VPAARDAHDRADVDDALGAGARAAPRWRELRWSGAPYAETPYAEMRSSGRRLTVALAEIAQAAVDLFAGPLRADVRARGAPNRVRFFVKHHPRRQRCGPGCGRVRAARHDERVRAHGA
jgi:hypothetical protein